VIDEITFGLFVLLALTSIPLSFAVGDLVGELVPPDEYDFKTPFGIAVDNNGRIIISDLGNPNLVKVFNPDGSFDFAFNGLAGGGTKFDMLTGIAVDNNNNIIVADIGLDSVQVYDENGNFMFELDNLNRINNILVNPIAIVVDRHNRIIVTVNSDISVPIFDQVQIFNSKGEFTNYSFDGTDNGGTAFRQPYGIAIDNSDNIIVSDASLGTVQVFNPQGEFMFELDIPDEEGRPFGNPYGIAIDSMDRILVTDAGRGLIHIFDSERNFIESFNGLDNDGEEFSFPVGVAVDSNDNIIVADVGLRTVQVFGDTPMEEPHELLPIPEDEEELTEPSDPVEKNGGCADCTAPTFYKNTQGKEIVKGGFSWNGNYTDVTGYHTPYDLIIVNVNDTNTFSMKAYENQGVHNFRWFQIGFGIKEVGIPTSEAEVLLVIRQSGDEIEEITLTDDENLMTFTNITRNIVECGYVVSFCVEISGNVVFRDVLKNNIVVINAVDRPGNSIRHFINDGINAEGESMNVPPTFELFNKKTNQQTDNLWLTLTRTDRVTDMWSDQNEIIYHKVSEDRFDRITPQAPIECNDTPLSEVNVPTRINCNFRALTAIWDQ